MGPDPTLTPCGCSNPAKPHPKADWSALRRFLPYLWPKGEGRLKARVVAAFLLVFVAKGATLIMPFAYKAAIDRMSAGMEPAVGLAVALVVAYAGARFAGVLFDNLRNAIFERVGQDAARRLAETVFRHIHALSLRFHLERRTGALTKIVERGTKSIDMMLYFLLFNIAPTLIELTAICLIFGFKFGPGLVVATLVMVAAYILFTRFVTEWRTHLQRRMNEVDNQAIARAVDSLLNYETVKYFNAEGREAERYGLAMRAFADAAVKNETISGLAQHRPVADHQPDDGRRDGLYRLGLVGRPVHHRRRRPGQHLARPALPAARHARLGLPDHPPGPDRHGGDVRDRRHAGRGEGRRRRSGSRRRRRPCPIRGRAFRL